MNSPSGEGFTPFLSGKIVKVSLVCLGTHIEIQANRQARMYCRVSVPPLGGGWCLMCGNIINLHQAALELAPREITNIASQAGYLEGIDAPAVLWLNGICASTGVGIIHGLVSGFLNLASGLDWIYEFPRSQWLKTNTQHLETSDCYFCSQTNDDSFPSTINHQLSTSFSQLPNWFEQDI